MTVVVLVAVVVRAWRRNSSISHAKAASGCVVVIIGTELAVVKERLWLPWCCGRQWRWQVWFEQCWKIVARDNGCCNVFLL